MPTLHLTGLDAELVTAARAAARAANVSTPEMAARLLRLGLQMTAGRAEGARAVNAALTDAERSTRARDAARARWAR